MRAEISGNGRSLTDIDLLRGVPAAAVQEATGCARITSIARGERIFDQGEPARRAHALLSGCVRITQTGSDGEETLLRFIGADDMFGTGTICTDQLYPADATALLDSVEASWDQRELLELMHRHAQIALNMVAILGRRLGEAQERLRELATQNVERRLAHALLRLGQRAGFEADGGLAIDIPFSRKDLADMAGTTIYTASRTMTDWRRRGLLRENNSTLLICQPARFRRFAEGDE